MVLDGKARFPVLVDGARVEAPSDPEELAEYVQHAVWAAWNRTAYPWECAVRPGRPFRRDSRGESASGSS